MTLLTAESSILHPHTNYSVLTASRQMPSPAPLASNNKNKWQKKLF